MKKFFLFLILFTFIQGCSDSSKDDEKIEIPPSVSIPQNLIGNWKVSYYTNISTGNSYQSNDKGYYISFLENNTIKLKDINGEFIATPYLSGNGTNYYIYSNIDPNKQVYIDVQNYSNWFQGGYEFVISYNNGYNSMRFYAKKQ
ncbi:hypothetical protein [Chryseobacterium mucoviscidosis]|uniref:hypothetical protein n=1 Tax=Chryseobacterium mucoviscidosis TaxID=1945581 RepID=UPI003018DF4D